MRATEIVYGVLFRPVATFSCLGEEKPLARAVGIWLVALIFSAVVNFSILRREIATSLLPAFGIPTAVTANLVWLYGLAYLSFSILAWFLMAAIYSLLAELFFRVSNGTGVLTCLALAGLPGAFGPGFQLLGKALSLEIITQPLAWGVSVWTVLLQILALRESLRIETTQALAIWVIPFLTIVLIVFLIVLMAGFLFSTGWV